MITRQQADFILDHLPFEIPTSITISKVATPPSYDEEAPNGIRPPDPNKYFTTISGDKKLAHKAYNKLIRAKA